MSFAEPLFLPQEVVMLLLKNQAKVDMINAEGNSPRDLARTSEIKNLIEGMRYTTFIDLEQNVFRELSEMNTYTCLQLRILILFMLKGGTYG